MIFVIFCLKMKNILFFIIFKILLVSCSYKSNHKCERDCSKSKESYECIYDFTIELFMTMSQDCLNCPTNKTDCFNSGCISADGFQRPVRSVNRQIPAPSIQVCQYDRIIMNVLNNMNTDESLSMHAHGLKQYGSQYMDGLAGVTQCPILATNSFKYEYKFY